MTNRSYNKSDFSRRFYPPYIIKSYCLPLLLLVGVICTLILTECKKASVELTPLNLDVSFFGHKGGGNNSFNPNFIENTVPSIKEGLKTMNGVEVDVQMSLDGTLWLFHHPDVGESSCNTNYHHSLILLKDSEIEKVQICSGNKQDRIYKLEELVSYWNSTIDGFPISMHIKLDQTRDTLNSPLIGGDVRYLGNVADQLIKVFKTMNHKNQLFAEVFDQAFLQKMHTYLPDVKICLLKEVDFPMQVDAAISLGYDGVSSAFNAASISYTEVKRAKDLGLVVQLWTPDTKADIISAYLLKPTHIQTNNLYGAIICEPYFTAK